MSHRWFLVFLVTVCLNATLLSADSVRIAVRSDDDAPDGAARVFGLTQPLNIIAPENLPRIGPSGHIIFYGQTFAAQPRSDERWGYFRINPDGTKRTIYEAGMPIPNASPLIYFSRPDVARPNLSGTSRVFTYTVGDQSVGGVRVDLCDEVTGSRYFGGTILP